MDLIQEFLNTGFESYWMKEGKARRELFIGKYTDEVILGLTQKEYQYSGNDNSFCYLLQHWLSPLASMGNAFPAVFGVYVDADHRLKMSKGLQDLFGNDYDAALDYQKSQIVAMINGGRNQNYRQVEHLDINSQLKFKILSIYCPESFFPVCTRPMAENYCDMFKIRHSRSASMLDLNLSLVDWSKANLPPDWDLYMAMYYSDWLFKNNKVESFSSMLPNTQVSNRSTVRSHPSTTISSVKVEKTVENPELSEGECKILFPVDSRVIHESYGIGIIKSISGDIATIEFDEVGEKNISIDFCVKNKKLKKVES